MPSSIKGRHRRPERTAVERVLCRRCSPLVFMSVLLVLFAHTLPETTAIWARISEASKQLRRGDRAKQHRNNPSPRAEHFDDVPMHRKVEPLSEGTSVKEAQERVQRATASLEDFNTQTHELLVKRNEKLEEALKDFNVV